MIVYSSFLNPWFAPFFGTCALAVGQIFNVSWFAVSSNTGLLIYTITLILLVRQIDRDIVSFLEFTDFLSQVAIKGNENTVQSILAKSTSSNAGEVKVTQRGISLPDLDAVGDADEGFV
jgi:hypothetical protein